MDDRHPRASDHANRHAGQLVGRRGRASAQDTRQDQWQRSHQRHPGLAEGPLRRTLRHYRGVRRRLPDAPSRPRRLRFEVCIGRRASPGAQLPGGRGPARAGSARSSAYEGPSVLVRRGAPRRYHTPHLPPVESFEELTDNPAWADELRRVYDNEVDRVDLTVGLYAEPVPEGFGFSDTAFRIFILMASRRLNSDRFFTTDYNAKIYTQTGLNWIDDNDMSTVLLRHFPEVLPSLRNVKNAFAPWQRTAS